jgi:glycosyltransferase involved in cell wall biosynthesis
MSRPLVVLDALLLRPRPTGVGRAILEWTDALAAADHGLRFAVLCTHPELLSGLADRPHWQLIRCPGARGGTLRKALWTQLRLPRLLRQLGADLLHCLQFAAPLRPPCPTVVTVHDLGYLRFPGTVEQPRLGYYRWLVPRSLHGAAAVVCNSEATAADVRQRFPGLRAPVRVTPFGVPGWVHRQPQATAIREQDAPFLFVGTLEPRKNLEGLLAAYAEFRQRRRAAGLPAPRLVLVGGRGWRDSGLRRALEPLVDAGAVVLKDYCGADELWRQYQLARALLFPSLHEGFGFPILEAMVARLPVLTSDRGAMAEVAADAALRVDPEARQELVRGLERLTDDADLRADLVRRGDARWRQWSWQRTVMATVATYREVLSRRA